MGNGNNFRQLPFTNGISSKCTDAQKNNDIVQTNMVKPSQQYFIPVDYETFSKWQQQVTEGIDVQNINWADIRNKLKNGIFGFDVVIIQQLLQAMENISVLISTYQPLLRTNIRQKIKGKTKNYFVSNFIWRFFSSFTMICL